MLNLYKYLYDQDSGVMKMPEIISICIVAYHNYDEILDAIESIERYTDKNLSKKIYIVDNDGNADDGSFKKTLGKYKDICYIDSGANVGFGKGHNMILNELNSKYHAIVNPDILLIEDAFTPIIEFMNSHKKVGMVVPRIVDESGALQEVYRKELTIFDMFIRMFCRELFPKRIANHTLQDKDYTKPFQVPFAQGSFLIVRTELLKELEGFDNRFFMYVEDADLCRRINLVSKLVYFPGATVIHKWKKESHRNKNLFKYHTESMKYYFLKWGVKWI